MSVRALLILSAFLASGAAAAPTLDPQFGSHAVIQRGRPILLSGKAAPNEHVMVSFGGEQQTAMADSSGRWRATFSARPAGGPYSIDLDGSTAAQDVEVGDVWLCSGQ